MRLIIPEGQEIDDIIINSSNKEIIKVQQPLKPIQYPIITADNNKTSFVKPDKTYYESNKGYPEVMVKVLNYGYFDGANHIVTLSICPFQYYPKEGKLEFYQDISFKLVMTYRGKKAVLVNNRKDEKQERVNIALKQLVDNPEDIPLYQVKHNKKGGLAKISSTPTGQYSYVIVTTNSLSSYFNKFVQWKNRKGIRVYVKTIESIVNEYSGDNISRISLTDDAGKLREFLNDAWVNNDIDYALLAGASIPYRYGCGGINSWDMDNPNDGYFKVLTDLYFADFNGDWNYDGDNYLGEIHVAYPTDMEDDPDYNQEIYVGRLLFQSSQEVLNWTDKLIGYEQNPFQGSFSKITKSLWSESDEMQDGNYAGVVIAGSSVLNNSFTNIKKGEEPSFNSNNPTAPTGAGIISELNNGYHFYNIYNHGAPTDITVRCPGEHNTSLSPRLGILNYDSNNWNWCQYENGNGLDNITSNNTSTIIYSIGCDNAQFINPAGSRCMADVFTSLGNSGGVAFIGNTSVGIVAFSPGYHSDFIYFLLDQTPREEHIGKALAFSKTRYYSGNEHYFSYDLNLFGDPEMPVWSASPSQFSSVSVSDNGSSITVNCGTSGSNICVNSIDNGASYYSVINASSATFSTSIRPLYVTITKTNYLPYLALTGGTLSGSITITDNLNILGSLTVPSGLFMTINSGVQLSFVNNASLTINGTLNAEGTSTNKITFTRSGSSSTWSGIRFNSGSEGTVKYCNISYVSNTAGIYCNNSYPTIEDNVLDNMSDIGIYLYNTSPTVVRNTIQGNSSSYGSVGIKCEESSSPQIGRNTIRYFTRGVGAYRYSSPLFWDGASTGRNKIVRTNTAVYGYYYCTPRFGESNYPWGTNYVDSASTYFANAETNTNIIAENNWWGTASPSSSKFYSVSSSSIDYTPYLTTPPSLSIRNEDKDKQTTTAIAYKIVGNDGSGVTQGSSSFFDDEDLKSAFKYEYDGDYESASKIYEKVFKKELNTDKGKYALVKLGACYKKNGKSGIANYLNSISDSYKNQKKDDITVIAFDLINQELLRNKEYDKVAANILHVKNELSINTEVEKSTLYSLVSLYVNCFNDAKTATGYYEELKQKCPTDALLTDCKILLGYQYDGSQDAKNIEKENQVIATAQQEVKIDNYPNPFNPTTNIAFSILQRSNVKLVVYDVLGKEVATLANSIYETGKYNVQFNGSSLASGMYFYTLTTAQGTISKKMLLVK